MIRVSSDNEVRVFIRQFENSMHATTEHSNVLDIFCDIETLIKFNEECELRTFKFSRYSEARSCLFRKFYMQILKSIIKNVSADTANTIPAEKLNHYLKFMFMNGNYKDCFQSLAWGINEFRPSYRLNKCVQLLEEFLNSHLLCKIIEEQCRVTCPVEQTCMWDELINIVANLPDKTANKLQTQNSEIFYPKAYITLVTGDIVTVLTKVHKSVESGKDTSLEFISRLLGKLCITGYADILMSELVCSLATSVKEDYIWCRITERIITGVPDRCLESVLMSLIYNLPWYGLMDKFLGDSILKKQKIQYLLCTKVLLFRHTEKVHVLQNVLGYLGTSHTRKHLLIKGDNLNDYIKPVKFAKGEEKRSGSEPLTSEDVFCIKGCFKDLLSVWGDSSAIRHTSPEQHLYLTRALFIAIGFLTDKDKQTHKDELIRLIMPGIEAHIGNSEHSIRKQGMLLAETFSTVIDPNGPKLKFEYQKDRDTEELIELMVPPSDPGIEHLEKKIGDVQIDEKKEEIKKTDVKEEVVETIEVDSDLDSDDDLEPFDMSHDVKVTKAKQPKYIRDCMEGLICNDEPDRVEICLKCAENLIRKKPDGLEEIATEFMKVLLHLGDKYSTPGFTLLRFKSMVAMAVCVPVPVADYITGEFYDRNYNLRQRMDILELAIKRQEKEFMYECEELRQQFKDILTTAGVNHSQFPVTPNKNLVSVDPMTPTFMCTPKGLTNLDIHKCLLINTLNDSGCHGDRLTSDGNSDDEHSPMSTDTESDFEDDTIFLEREVEGCENPEVDNLNESIQFSTSFIAGHLMADNQIKKKSHASAKNQGSNPLASSTMMVDKKEPLNKKRKPVQRGVSIPKASSTVLYKPFPERKVNKSFSPVVKLQNLQPRETVLSGNKDIVSNNNTGSVFTWSLQHSSIDVPLEESYMRSVKKRCNKPPHPARQMSQARSHKISSRTNLCRNQTVNGLSVIDEKSTCKNNMIVNDCLSSNDTLYSKTNTIPRSSTRMDLCKVQREITQGETFKKPSVSSQDSKTNVERKNSVVKKLMRFRESFKRRNGTSDLRTLATV